MVQQIQPIAQQPVVNQAQPVSQPLEQMQPVDGETSIWKKWWLWLIIAVVIIGISFGIYSLLM